MVHLPQISVVPMGGPACEPVRSTTTKPNTDHDPLLKWICHRNGGRQLGEDAHRYVDRTGVAMFSFLRTIMLNLLKRGGYRSFRQGSGIWYSTPRLALGGVTTAVTTT